LPVRIRLRLAGSAMLDVTVWASAESGSMTARWAVLDPEFSSSDELTQGGIL